MKFGKTWILPVLLFAALSLTGKEYKLMEDGKALCEIVLPANAPEHCKYAAKELSAYLGKIGGGKGPAVVTEQSGKAYPISFQESKDKKLKVDGFALNATDKGLVIEHNTAAGALYGAYEILKKYGGIRWLVPGDDGEYYTVKKVIAVPEGTSVHNPFRRIRAGNNLGLSRAGRLWLPRNYMNNLVSRAALNKNKEYQELGAKVAEGYHCFSRLLTGEPNDWKKINKKLEVLFKEHPEYFPLINGKRVNLTSARGGASDKQPCTSNPDVIRIMKKNLEDCIENRVNPDGIYLFYDNDGTGWCQCEECRKIDSEEDRKNNWVTQRYWKLYQDLTRDILKKYPNAIIIGNPYQNFTELPQDRSLVQKSGWIELGFNRTCWRHNIDDPKCLTNPTYLRRYLAWGSLGNPMTSWEQLTAAGRNFLPVEFTVRDRLKFYRKINCEMFPEVIAPYTNIRKWPKMSQDMWLAMWQSMYLMAQAQWDENFDYDGEYEKINALYYGKAWEGGMKELRKLLVKAFSETSGCAGHGHGNPLGKMLSQPGVHGKLLALFAQAEKAASQDPDKRALKHVKMDREFFALTWEESYKQFLSNFREVNAYRKKGEIKIDGVIDEQDWKNTDIITNFVCQRAANVNGKAVYQPVSPEQQTFLRIVYEPDYIYFAIEAMEPTPEKMVTEIKKHDGPVWEDNTLEIFLSHPDMGNSYYQMIYNAKGVCFDQLVIPGKGADKKFDAKGEFAVKILKDRWVLEGRFPSDTLGEKCFDGQIWKLNIERRRYLTDGTNVPSSLSVGHGKNVSVFQNMNFVKERKVHLASAGDMEMRYFANGSFNELEDASKNSNLKNWKVIGGKAPKGWMFGGKNAQLEMILHPGSSNNYFMRSKNGMVFQHYRAYPKHVKYYLKARGKGKLWVFCLQETRRKGKILKGFPAHTCKTLDIDSKEWQTYSFEYKTDVPEMHIVPGFKVTAGEVDVDDLVVVPVNK
ncbi:MAG: DUF4838 domain-containing protein [Lentisphaeria bacterium]|nr:DUF4838 domain-containing protein [Lentisphaeria bacterium]